MTNTEETKCFIIVFGAEHKSLIFASQITQKIYNILCPTSDKKWISPSYTSTTNTNVSNAFFVRGNISENKLSNFYRKKIEEVLSEDEIKRTSFYIKQVQDEEDVFGID